MATIIDHSETVSGLQILTTTIVRHDAHSPPGKVVVNTDGLNLTVGSTLDVKAGATVNANGLNLGALSTVNVQGGALFDVTGPIQLGALSNINIGQNGTVELGSSIGLAALSNINFIGPNATLKVAPAAQGQLLSPSSAGNIVGFGDTDKIDMLGMSGVTHAEWSQNLIQQLLGWGEVQLFNAQNVEVGSISIYGSYTSANFAVHGDGHHGTNITFVPTLGHP